MKLKDFDYNLPQNLIAQRPLRERSSSRLLVLSREDGSVRHRRFTDILDYLETGDALVLNDTKVMPARLFAEKETGGKVEVFLLKEVEEGTWKALLRPSAKVKKGARLKFADSDVVCEALDEPGEKTRLVKFTNLSLRGASKMRRSNLRSEIASPTSWARNDREAFYEFLEKIGHMPLPPYIKREATEDDLKAYQTVFAKKTGAVAAPTAGLHFDAALLDKIRAKGVKIVFVTLHVGYGTFMPVEEENIHRHKMHAESFEISRETAGVINEARVKGGKVVSCGTTVTRVLESAAGPNGALKEACGETDLFIYPGFKFKIVDKLTTNFHLPRTTLLMLVSAFAGRENVLSAYSEAVREQYRFYSYGDAMCVV